MTPTIYHFPPAPPGTFLVWYFNRANFCTVLEI
jgi:hypothetical protein